MQKHKILALLGVLACALWVTAVVAADAPKGPVTVTNFGGKGTVQFDHATHAEPTCVSCHHNEADGKYKCGECHLAEDAASGAPKFKDAAHKKDVGACYSCHFGKEPTAKKLKCGDCHK